MRKSTFAILLVAAIGLAGCGVSQFTGKTDASYHVTAPNGVTTDANYSSNKDQAGFSAEIDPSTGKVSVHVDRSNTPEAAIAAAANAQAAATQALVNVLNTVLPIIQSAAQGAIVGGAPGAAAGAAAKVLTTPKAASAPIPAPVPTPAPAATLP